MATVTCLRHFETDIDPKTPPTEWDLSKDGAAAEAAFLEEDWLDSLDAVYTSPERKAERTATAVASEPPLISRRTRTRSVSTDRSSGTGAPSTRAVASCGLKSRALSRSP